MHELSITDKLLALTLRHAEQAGATRVLKLNLVIGEFSSVVDESVQFYWDIVSKDTIAEGAELAFRRVPGLLRCQACAHTFSLSGYDGQCPNCGAARTSIVDGDQFKLESIDIEGPEEG